MMSAVNQERTHLITRWLSYNNHTRNFSELNIRPSIDCVLPLFVCLFSLVAVIGIIGNVAIIIVIVRHRLYRMSTLFLVGNIALCEVIRCVVVLPASAVQLFLHNWHFGSAMCSLLPMLQWCPIFVTSLLFLVLSIVRLLWVFGRNYLPLPRWVWILSVVLAWAAAICVTSPFIVYMSMINISEHLGPRFGGLGICMLKLNSQSTMAHLVPAMYVVMFLLPMIITTIMFAIILFKTDYKTKSESPNRSSMTHENLPLNITFSEENNENLSDVVESNPRNIEVESNSVDRQPPTTNRSVLDWTNEQRTNKYIVVMTILFAIMWLPFVSFFAITWSHDGPFPVQREEYMDVLNVVFLLLGFMTSCSFPIVFSLWQVSNERKQKLKRFFRLPKRQQVQ